MPKPDLRWSVTYAVAVLTFAIAEGLAMRGDIGGRTFSSQVRWAQSAMPSTARVVARAVLIASAVWLGAHLTSGVE